MIEHEPTEHPPVTRDQVIAAFARLKKQGVENPWDENVETKQAWKLYKDFSNLAAKKSAESNDPKAPLELNQQVSIDMIIGEAGFEPDEDNLDAILDFLQQDLQAAEAMGDEGFASELRDKIKTYTEKLETLPDE